MLNETAVLGWSALIIIIAIFVQVLLAVPQMGLGYLLSAREAQTPLTGMAARIDRGVKNAAIGYALFAPAALLVVANGASTSSTLLAANLYLWARIVYFVVYAAAVPGVRTLAWLVGVLATVWLWGLAILFLLRQYTVLTNWQADLVPRF